MSDIKTVVNGTKRSVTLISPGFQSVTFDAGEEKKFDVESFKKYERCITTITGIDKEFRVVKDIKVDVVVKQGFVEEVKEEAVVLSPVELADKELKTAEEYLSSLPAKARKVTAEAANQRVIAAKDKLAKLTEV